MISDRLLHELLSFREERDWEKFHTPKNLSSAICVEASELLEIFQWSRDSDQEQILQSRRKDIQNEVADLVILLSYLCHDLGIDVERAVMDKLEIDRLKYPIEKSKGVATKYDRL